MESVWWVFQELYKKGLIYKGFKVRIFWFFCRRMEKDLSFWRCDFKVMHFSTGLHTTLSNFEAGLNYKDVNDPAGEALFINYNFFESFLLRYFAERTRKLLIQYINQSINRPIDRISEQLRTSNQSINGWLAWHGAVPGTPTVAVNFIDLWSKFFLPTPENIFLHSGRCPDSFRITS